MDDITWSNSDYGYCLTYPGWGRTDLRVINLMDPDYPDYWPEDSTLLSPAVSADARLESDYEYLSGQNFNASRGSYP